MVGKIFAFFPLLPEFCNFVIFWVLVNFTTHLLHVSQVDGEVRV